MSDYIKREDVLQAIAGLLNVVEQIDSADVAEVVEAGIITCFGIKFLVEDDIIKVKWRHGDKHYIVPLAGLLELWEKYEEQEHE